MSHASRLANAVPSLVLSSPAHRLLSGRYALLEFTGRRTGRTYRAPIPYVRHGSQVLLSTDSPWWRDLADRPAVRLRLRGRDVRGSALVVADEREAAGVLGTLVPGVRGYSRTAGLGNAAQLSDGDLLRAVTTGGRHSIEVTVDDVR